MSDRAKTPLNRSEEILRAWGVAWGPSHCRLSTNGDPNLNGQIAIGYNQMITQKCSMVLVSGLSVGTMYRWIVLHYTQVSVHTNNPNQCAAIIRPCHMLAGRPEWTQSPKITQLRSGTESRARTVFPHLEDQLGLNNLATNWCTAASRFVHQRGHPIAMD